MKDLYTLLTDIEAKTRAAASKAYTLASAYAAAGNTVDAADAGYTGRNLSQEADSFLNMKNNFKEDRAPVEPKPITAKASMQMPNGKIMDAVVTATERRNG